MEVNNIRSILSNKFHEAQAIMNKKEKVLNIVSQGIKATASTPWAKKYKKDIELMGMMKGLSLLKPKYNSYCYFCPFVHYFSD